MKTQLAQFIRRCITYFFFPGILFFMGCLNLSGDIVEADARARGTWWWYVNPKDHAEYLKFAEENRINEIYFHTNFNDRDFSNSRIGSFIESAGKRGIKVFLLTSEYEHIWDRELFKKLMDDYRVFQNSMPKRKRFAGLHIDAEPQSHPEFGAKRASFLQDYLDFVVWVCSSYKGGPENYIGTIDFDIAYWFDSDVRYKGEATKLYKALMLEADRVFVMSYKDTAEKIYDISKEELAFAKSIDKEIILSVETGSVDYGTDVSFYGKGQSYFQDQLRILQGLMDETENANCGLSIHHISPWHDMMR